MKDNKNTYTDLKTKKLEKSKLEILASVPPSFWETFRAEALKNLNEAVALDGFRKGNIPESILVSKLGEMTILQEMAELAIPRAYVNILMDNKIDAIGKPNIQITKLAKGNPIEFKAETDIVPEFSLPEYKDLAKKEVNKDKKNSIEVNEKEVEDAILNVRKSFASHEGHDHSKMTKEEHDKAIMNNLPEFNDEFVKKVGDYKDVADFKQKVSGIILEDKKAQARDKLRISIAEAISEKTKVEIPESMIESELSRTEAQFNADLERMNVKMEDYLKHAKKTMEDLKTEWRPYAEKKAKLQLIINRIAEVENIRPSKEDIDGEVNVILSQYKDADREKATVYAETVLTNEKVFQFLEGQSE